MYGVSLLLCCFRLNVFRRRKQHTHRHTCTRQFISHRTTIERSVYGVCILCGCTWYDMQLACIFASHRKHQNWNDVLLLRRIFPSYKKKECCFAESRRFMSTTTRSMKDKKINWIAGMFFLSFNSSGKSMCVWIENFPERKQWNNIQIDK